MDSLDFFFFVSSKFLVSEINMTPLRVKTLFRGGRCSEFLKLVMKLTETWNSENSSNGGVK